MTAALRVVLVWALLTLTALFTAGAAAAHPTAGPTTVSATCNQQTQLQEPCSLRLTGAGTSAAGPAAAPREPEPDIPPWVFAVGAIAAVAVVAFWSTRRRP